MEQVYVLAPQTRGGPDITSTAPETRLIPAICGQYGILKLGEHAQTEQFHAIVHEAMKDEHVPEQSAISPFELKQRRD